MSNNTEQELAEKIADAIVSAREELGWSTAELARRAFRDNYHAGRVKQIERGEKPRVSFYSVVKLLSAMGFEINLKQTKEVAQPYDASITKGYSKKKRQPIVAKKWKY